MLPVMKIENVHIGHVCEKLCVAPVVWLIPVYQIRIHFLSSSLLFLPLPLPFPPTHSAFVLFIPSLSFFMNFVLTPLLSDMSIATPAFLSFPFGWNIFVYPLTFSLFVSLALKWVSCTAYMWVLLFYPINHPMSFVLFCFAFIGG